jgi:hypothetical protein
LAASDVALVVLAVAVVLAAVVLAAVAILPLLTFRYKSITLMLLPFGHPCPSSTVFSNPPYPSLDQSPYFNA